MCQDIIFLVWCLCHCFCQPWLHFWVTVTSTIIYMAYAFSLTWTQILQCHFMNLTYISWSNNSSLSIIAFSSICDQAYDLQSANLTYNSYLARTQIMSYHFLTMTYIPRSSAVFNLSLLLTVFKILVSYAYPQFYYPLQFFFIRESHLPQY